MKFRAVVEMEDGSIHKLPNIIKSLTECGACDKARELAVMAYGSDIADIQVTKIVEIKT